ncbi:restriction endonuclease subunit S [Paenibacillus sp. YAF4_2]|uniref:restriction endonuclease subunit S n=1 Tax=Paenibacillus sp. YAF4_2 TaxID=3233085 RepID=UPI003F95ED94
MSDNITKPPQIRFAGFTDAWEQRPFKELTEIRRGLTYSPSNVRDTGVRVLRSSNINEDTFVLKNDDVFVVPSAINIDFVKENDILITSANGSSRLVGKHALIKNVSDNAVHGGFMLVASANEPEFVNALMSSPWYDKFINVYVAGGNGAIGNLSKSDLEEQKVYVPDVAEQKKLGEFFNNLDHHITLHQRKLELLKETKKSLLLKMFPKDGANVPEIRFAGFTDAWEQRKLGDITNYIKGFAFKSADYQKNGVRIIRVSDLDRDSIKTSKDSIFVGSKIANDNKRYRIKKNEIIITTVGSKAEMKESAVGRPIIISEDSEYLLNQNLVKITPLDDCDSYFIYSQLLQPKYTDYIAMIERGNANQANIAINDLWEYRFEVPSMEEQKSIGNFFKQLDDIITLQQRDLNSLKNLKKSMLQQLFI